MSKLMTKTFTIPVVVNLQYHEELIDKEAQFIATSLRDKINKTLNNTVSVVRWYVDKPNESDIELK
jgi:hypothetical protein